MRVIYAIKHRFLSLLSHKSMILLRKQLLILERYVGRCRDRCRAGALVYVLLCSAALLGHRVAHADEVWGYIDDKGQSHFASYKVDAHYQLFSRQEIAAVAPNARVSTAKAPNTNAPNSKALNLKTLVAKATITKATDPKAAASQAVVTINPTFVGRLLQAKAPNVQPSHGNSTGNTNGSVKASLPVLWPTNTLAGALPASLAAVSASWIATGGQWPAELIVAPKKGKPVVVVLPPEIKAFYDQSGGYQAVKPILRDAAKRFAVDYELLQAMITVESRFDPVAVSPKAAVGLMQIISPTAQRYGVRPDPKRGVYYKLLDPVVNIHTGAQYLRDLIKMFPKRLDLAVAAYNAGEGAVQRVGNQVPPYPETQNYVVSVLQLYLHLKPSAATTVLALPASSLLPIPSQPVVTDTVNVAAGQTGAAQSMVQGAPASLATPSMMAAPSPNSSSNASASPSSTLSTSDADRTTTSAPAGAVTTAAPKPVHNAAHPPLAK